MWQEQRRKGLIWLTVWECCLSWQGRYGGSSLRALITLKFWMENREKWMMMLAHSPPSFNLEPQPTECYGIHSNGSYYLNERNLETSSKACTKVGFLVTLDPIRLTILTITRKNSLGLTITVFGCGWLSLCYTSFLGHDPDSSVSFLQNIWKGNMIFECVATEKDERLKEETQCLWLDFIHSS